MEALIIRHAATAGNERGAYVGSTDEPISARGKDQARAAAGRLGQAIKVDLPLVYVSPLLRARQTAGLLLPNARQVLVDDLREMDFGAFEGRTSKELCDPQMGDPRYQAWVDGLCLGPCPGGESRAQLVARTVAGIRRVLADAEGRGLSQAVVVAHGGTVMGALDALARGGDQAGQPEGPFALFRWRVGPCEGYLARVAWVDGDPLLLGPTRV